MKNFRLRVLSKGKQLPVAASGVRAPDTLVGKLAQKWGLKQF